MTFTVALAGGGTAGHIEPALAVGEALQNRHDAKVIALGTERGLETDIVPDRGFALHLIEPVPVPRKISLDLVALPLKVMRSVRQTRRIFTEEGVDAVFGTGGYVSAPAYLAAKSLRLPFYVHESNAIAGAANKLGVKLGGVGFNAVTGSGMPGEVVGVPVRPGLGQDPAGEAAARGRQRWGLDPDRPVVLVTGGSQGAASLNAAVADARERLIASGYQILHAYGKKNEAPAELAHHVAVPYIDDMAAAYAVADLIVCRAGAMTVAEVTAARLPAIYVPLPHGNGEQGLNADEVVAAGAALRVSDETLTGDWLTGAVDEVFAEPDRLAEMRTAYDSTSAGDVAATLADRIAAPASPKENFQ
ncbi:undecaprenyldiphospho-muramoylpentapeptide beta-N-acetylglucosaminyltransferase [Corynebacterium sp.]|uniref:undecaprenyldiphospho-muramoylpentapeptide beta-N-acetylglucosaminyltransferase n=1 Tax=Corynebacterium sp. TaxID=1720 RepID=UPI003734C7C7